MSEKIPKAITLRELTEKLDRMVQRQIKKQGKDWVIVYRKREKMIDFYCCSLLRDQIFVPDLDEKGRMKWLWHMSGRKWIRQRGDMIFQLRELLQDVMRFQAQAKSRR